MVVLSPLCLCQTLWVWRAWPGQVEISEHEAACVWARFSRKLSLPAHCPLAHCPSCCSHCPLLCLQELKNNRGKVYGPFQAPLLQLPWMLVLGKGKTWIWRAEATGAAVIFIPVLIRGPTSIYGHNNKRHRDSQCILPAVEISLGSWRLCSRAENERGNWFILTVHYCNSEQFI